MLMGDMHGGGSMCGGGGMREGEMATEAGGTHLTSIHFCWSLFYLLHKQKFKKLQLISTRSYRFYLIAYCEKLA